jgi:hypothetical protein
MLAQFDQHLDLPGVLDWLGRHLDFWAVVQARPKRPRAAGCVFIHCSRVRAARSHEYR